VSTADRDAEPAVADVGRARLSTVGSPVCAPDWLALREPADAAARAVDLPELLVPALPAIGAHRPLRVHDLGAGAGSMARWLAPRLPGPQHWVLHDRDAGLLARAAATMPAGPTGPVVTVETRCDDATRADLDDADLVVASALLDLFTADDLEAVMEAVAGAGGPALFTLTVTGAATVDPPDPRDPEVAAAFAEHQRRRPEERPEGNPLLGPDAGPAAADALRVRGMTVHTRPTPWRLGPTDQELAHEWIAGWLDAALTARPGLAANDADRARLRRADAVLRVEVGHVDVLALPR
jgi:hypothetical protein